MIAIDMCGWMTVLVWVLVFWAGITIALLAGHHRAKSGQWRPYSKEEVEDPDWDRKH